MPSGAPDGGGYERRLDDYIDVAERMAEFYDRYPEGSLRAAVPEKPWELAIVTGTKKDGTPTTQTFIVYTAIAYRRPDDPAPGIGVAWEIWPGRTPYTLGSELMNAETSAWGRAMAALGIATKRGIASRQEVRAWRAEREDGLPVNSDGSLSRSRTTDEEKDAAGVMTSGQLAEHTALQPKRAEQPTAERLSATPPDDPFYVQPPNFRPGQDVNLMELLPEAWQPAEPATPLSPGTIAQAQQKAMHAAFNALGVKDREARLAWTRKTLGLDVLASSSDLSYKQAGDLLAALAARQRADKVTT